MTNVPMTPPVRTVLLPSEALDAIWHAHQDVIGGPCETSLLGILAAQSAFETARWRSMWCWNFGNVGGHGPGGAWTNIHGAGEMVDGKPVPRPTGEAGAFAAWPSKIEGARGYVSFLGIASHPPAPNRYAAAWDAARAGDVAAFCAGLKAGGYFTDGLTHYTHGVADQYAWLQRGPLPEFLASLTPTERPPPETAA